MTSNVFTKNEILQNLSSKGYFIDTYTLDTFFEKWKVEAIFEDDNGVEFYDKNTLELVVSNLFNGQNQTQEQKPSSVPEQPQAEAVQNPQAEEANKETNKENIIDNYNPHAGILTAAMKSMGGENFEEQNPPQQGLVGELSNSYQVENTNPPPINPQVFQNPQPAQFEMPQNVARPNMTNMVQQGAYSPSFSDVDIDDATEFDDMSLLSESLEAQEKLREYVVSELSRKNLDVTPQSNEFKLDISERTISMVARTMAKKIAKHISTIVAQDAKAAAKLAAAEEANKKLENRARDLETQNKKLRLLLAESNRNLNSYKPSIFGLYKKVDPNKK